MKNGIPIRPRLLLRIDRRREPRMFCEKQVIISRDGGTPLVGAATVTDWSFHGIRVRLGLDLHTGDVVKVVMPECALDAQVVWCAQSADGFECGLRFLDPADATFFNLGGC